MIRGFSAFISRIIIVHFTTMHYADIYLHVVVVVMKCLRGLTFEIHFPIAICVKYIDNPLHQRILLQLGQGHELLYAQGSGVI